MVPTAGNRRTKSLRFTVGGNDDCPDLQTGIDNEHSRHDWELEQSCGCEDNIENNNNTSKPVVMCLPAELISEDENTI